MNLTLPDWPFSHISPRSCSICVSSHFIIDPLLCEGRMGGGIGHGSIVERCSIASLAGCPEEEPTM